MENAIVISRTQNKELQEILKGLEIGETASFNNKEYTKASEDSASYEYSNVWDKYKFNKGEVIGSYRIQKSVSASDIETVLVNSFEGGSNYWMGLNNQTEIWNKKPDGIPLSTWATQMLLEGETLDFYDIEDEEETWTLNLEQLINGIKLNYELRTWDNNIEDGDASTADCIIQYGIFGKIVYG